MSDTTIPFPPMTDDQERQLIRELVEHHGLTPPPEDDFDEWALIDPEVFDPDYFPTLETY